MAACLEIKVYPLSGKQSLVRDKSGIIKCFLKSAPEHGKANQELIKLLSKHLAMSQTCIDIIQGATSRKKVVKINTTLPMLEILARLNIETQAPLQGT